MIKKLLLGGDKFMSGMHLRQHRFMSCDCEPFNKNEERIQKIKKAEDLRFFFTHDMAYGDYKDLPKRTAVDKVLHDKVFNIAKNSKYDGYQKGLALMFYSFFW